MEEALLYYTNLKQRSYRCTVRNNQFVYNIRNKTISFADIIQLISYIDFIERMKYEKLPILICFEHIYDIDKLVIVLLESICYYALITFKRPIQISFKRIERKISQEGISSSLLNLLTTGKKEHIQAFIKKYSKDIYRDHFRRVISKNVPADSSELNDVLFEVNAFLKLYDVAKKTREEVVNVIAELIGNAVEHTDSDCILDIDVTRPEYFKIGTDGSQSYYGINIVVVNYGEKLLGYDIKNLLSRKDILKGRYCEVEAAYKTHNCYFNEEYTEEDFYNIAVFQDKISGRSEIAATGGTGLTKLICSLENRADAHECFVVSGNRGILFDKKYLEYNSKRWIGFNDSNDFLKDAPNKELLIRESFWIPGTAFKLNLVLEKEQKEEEES